MLCIQFSPNPTHVIKLPQLLSADVLNFYLTGSDCSDLVSKLRRHTVATTFFLRSHCQTCAGCPEMILLCFNRTAALRIELCRYKRAFSLSHVSCRRRRRRRWPRVGAINDMSTHGHAWLHEWRIVWRKSPKLRQRQITELYHHADFHTDRSETSPRAKNTYFPL